MKPRRRGLQVPAQLQEEGRASSKDSMPEASTPVPYYSSVRPRPGPAGQQLLRLGRCPAGGLLVQALPPFLELLFTSGRPKAVHFFECFQGNSPKPSFCLFVYR